MPTINSVCKVLVLTVTAIAFAFLTSNRLQAGCQTTSKAQDTQVSTGTSQLTDLDRLISQGDRSINKQDYTDAEKRLKTGLQRAQNLHENFMTARFMNRLAKVCACTGRYREALDYLNRTLLLLEHLPNYEVPLAMTYYDQGLLLDNLSRHDEAITQLIRSLQVYHSKNDPIGEIMCLASLGFIYAYLGQQDKAQDAFQHGWDLGNTLKSGDQIALDSMASCEDGLANFAAGSGRYDKALDYLTRARDDYRAANDQQNLGRILNILGGFY